MDELLLYQKQINILLNRLKPFKLIDVSFSLTKIPDSNQFSLIYSFKIDHEKYWVSSPNFDEDYFNEVEKLDNYDYGEFLEDIPKYIGIEPIVVEANKYDHIGKKVYSPLITLLNSKRLNGTITFDNSSIAPIVTFELFDSDEFKSIYDVANFVGNNGFSIDNMRFFDIW
jgi:hypothetical protein